jgi:hypothetical protein
MQLACCSQCHVACSCCIAHVCTPTVMPLCDPVLLLLHCCCCWLVGEQQLNSTACHESYLCCGWLFDGTRSHL